MTSRIIKIPSYLFGEFVESPPNRRRVVADIFGNNRLEAHEVNEYGILSAVKSSAKNQADLGSMPRKNIAEVLKKTMDYFLDNQVKYKLVSLLTGSPLKLIIDSMEKVKEWCRDLDHFVAKALPEKDAIYQNSSPVVVLIPSNSNLEIPWVLAQTLLSRNAAILRPSSGGASAYVTFEFIRAFNQAIDAINDPALQILRQSIAMVNSKPDIFISNTTVDGWNYVFFGSNETIKEVETTIKNIVDPRRIIGFGTGLSTTIVAEDATINSDLCQSILESVSINAGNECDSTDIIYAHTSQYQELIATLNELCINYGSCHPFADKSIGWVHSDNVTYIQGELSRRGVINQLRQKLAEPNSCIQIDCSVIPLSEFETTLEYPGPIASVRPYDDLGQVSRLIRRDLKDNRMTKSLVSSVYTGSRDAFDRIVPILSAHSIKLNIPTHEFNIMQPHQGIFILKELCDPVYLDLKR